MKNEVRDERMQGTMYMQLKRGKTSYGGKLKEKEENKLIGGDSAYEGSSA